MRKLQNLNRMALVRRRRRRGGRDHVIAFESDVPWRTGPKKALEHETQGFRIGDPPPMPIQMSCSVISSAAHSFAHMLGLQPADGFTAGRRRHRPPLERGKRTSSSYRCDSRRTGSRDVGHAQAPSLSSAMGQAVGNRLELIATGSASGQVGYPHADAWRFPDGRAAARDRASLGRNHVLDQSLLRSRRTPRCPARELGSRRSTLY